MSSIGTNSMSDDTHNGVDPVMCDNSRWNITSKPKTKSLILSATKYTYGFNLVECPHTEVTVSVKQSVIDVPDQAIINQTNEHIFQWKKIDLPTKIETVRLNSIVKELSQYNITYKYIYGIGGLRDETGIIHSLMHRILFAIALFSKDLSTIGLMITASHNPSSYNGIKIMKDNTPFLTDVERYIFNKVINMSVGLFHNLLHRYNKDIITKQIILYYGCDTRSSCIYISSMIDFYKSLFNKIINIKMVTTPQFYYTLTHRVDRYNIVSDPNMYMSEFERVINKLQMDEDMIKNLNIVVDCSNSVCYLTLKHILKELNIRRINIITDQDQLLNNKCGADYVLHHYKNLPAIYPNGSLVASLDGDGDRLVLSYSTNHVDKPRKSYLFDGNKICALYLYYLAFLSQHDTFFFSKIRIGIIHTAYTNSAFVSYVNKLQEQNLHLNLNLIKTTPGMENLHKVADNYEIGIYFEANGHGNILIKTEHTVLSPLCMLNSMDFEDGIATMFTVIYILNKLSLSVDQWNDLYHETPYLLSKQEMINRDRLIVNTLDGTIIHPKKFADKIDELRSCYDYVRIYLRPSTTEKLVRIYLEVHNECSLNTVDNKILSDLETKIKKEIVELDR